MELQRQLLEKEEALGRLEEERAQREAQKARMPHNLLESSKKISAGSMSLF